MKLLVKFTKKGPARYISHLDLLRCVQRTLRLMEAPVAYSQGFNPHPQLTFAQALSLFMESEGEYFLVELTADMAPADFVDGFNKNGYAGITAVAARPLQEGERTPMARVAAARYAYEMGMDRGEVEAAIGWILGEEELWFDKKGKKGITKVNMRPMIYEMAYDGRTLTMLVGCGENNLPPREPVNALLAHMGEDRRVENWHMTRLDLYEMDENGYRPFL
ncbi:TIGR03936 family radical SAM-associated protein [Eubacteriales bacterium OttesenSCG-928-M02]|nr:TIGR03936 family radical SAM-associated protein [Eubacteriales bacterium OttesenSCG-928-M02]